MTDDLKTLRHSASHVLAHAVKDLFSGVKLGIGPATEEGFYYDFDCEHSFSIEDLSKIEKRMQEIAKESLPFEQSFMKRNDAIEFFKRRGEVYKCELIEELIDENVSVYTSGSFIDLCKGPHVVTSREIGVFKLLSVAGAYWRGNEKNKMLQRIYGTAFKNKQDLKEYLERIEEAKKRDHRVLGKQLDLFSFHDEAPAVPFFHPKGMNLYNKLLAYWREEHAREGYVEIKTPLIMRDTLWHKSGHYEHYKDNMYFTDIDEQQFAVKPMNCPGGLLIYKGIQHSYRDFPIKMAELGLVHRHERSGVTHGLFRVKSFTIDDAHIFCLEDQIEAEVQKAIALILKVYKTFQFDTVHLELSTRPDDSMGSDEMWEKATTSLRNALDNSKIDYVVNEGDGAFYGPKIDFHILDSLKRSWQCGTVQLDFSMPERFELEYIGSDGQPHRPVMIHRAAFGSIERFFGILIEHFGGYFPLWLSPLQVRILTISEKVAKYAKDFEKELREYGIECEADLRSEKIGYKIREAEKLKVNYMCIIGEKEAEANTISVRQHGKRDLGIMSKNEFIQQIQEKISKRIEQ